MALGEEGVTGRGVRSSRRLLTWVRGHNYDVGVRYWPVARAIRLADPERQWQVLDVGSGSSGIVPHLPGWRVTRTDLQREAHNGLPFVRASVLELPFRDRSWDVVVCVDVLEHLPESIREGAMRELVRVSRKLLVVAFPWGPTARMADLRFANAAVACGQTPPEWVRQHLMHVYPEPELLDRLLPKLAAGRPYREQRFFNESLALQRSHRFLALRFTSGYLAWSLLCGLGLPILARPVHSSRGYRCISVVQFG